MLLLSCSPDEETQAQIVAHIALISKDSPALRIHKQSQITEKADLFRLCFHLLMSNNEFSSCLKGVPNSARLFTCAISFIRHEKPL